MSEDMKRKKPTDPGLDIMELEKVGGGMSVPGQGDDRNILGGPEGKDGGPIGIGVKPTRWPPN